MLASLLLPKVMQGKPRPELSAGSEPVLAPAGVGLMPAPLSTGCLATDSPVLCGQSTSEHSPGFVMKIVLCKLIAHVSTGIVH